MTATAVQIYLDDYSQYIYVYLFSTSGRGDA